MDSLDLLTRLRAHLERQPDVHCRPEFGNQVFYVGGTQFAALTDRAVLMHLPASELTPVLQRGLGRPFVSAGAMSRNGWIEIPIARAAPLGEELERLLDAAHRAAQHAHRRVRRSHPSRARRRGPTRLA